MVNTHPTAAGTRLALETDLDRLRQRRTKLEAHRQRAAVELDSATRQRRELLLSGRVDDQLLGSVDQCIATAEMALQGIAEAIAQITEGVAAHEAQLVHQSDRSGRELAAEQGESLAARLADSIAALNPAAEQFANALAARQGVADQATAEALLAICGEITMAMNSFTAELRTYVAQLRAA
jgi:hypothetical protein